jgi:hypothetical protein
MPTRSAWLSILAIAACSGKHSSPPPDSSNNPPPRVIPGGGIGDGPIDGVVNLYVIDDATRTPITGATVRVGTVDGTTDATGLFIATGVRGPQTAIAKAAGYRSEMWIAANGANITLDVQAAIDSPVTSANVSGSITGFDQITLAAGHHKTAIVTYSQNDAVGDKENNIATANSTNVCDVVALAGQGCAFTVTTRTGHVALVAAIYDHDTTVTPNTFSLIGWAYRTGVTVQSGVGQTGQSLAMVAGGSLVDVTVDFGAPPSALATVAGIVGIELNTSEGILQLPVVLAPTTNRLRVPALSVLPGSTYRFTGFATNGGGSPTMSSVVLARGQTTTALSAGTWLPPPSGVALTRGGGTWTPATGALVQGAEWAQMDGTHVLAVTTFDDSASIAIPDVVALPATGALTASATALAGTLDVTSFALDNDKTKITGASAQNATIN